MFTHKRNEHVYYAHSADELPYDKWQTAQDHAHNVSEMASEFAQPFGASDFARAAGMLHDLGKYTEAFQRRLRGEGTRVDHATAGAIIAVERWRDIGKLIAFCVAGHHAGLANGDGDGDGLSTLKQRLSYKFGTNRTDIPKLDECWRSELDLADKLAVPSIKPDKNHPFFSLSFFTRMLYSCLVDADYLDTEAFYAKLNNTVVERSGYPSLKELQYHLQHHLSALRQRASDSIADSDVSNANAKLNCLRGSILDFAIKRAVESPGLFSLTVPTGGGKTLTSMAFALEHAQLHKLRRIIYVIPYTSIIEQNAAVFRRAFGDLGEQAVLEHHSTFNDASIRDIDTRDKLRLASENWDAPIVVTTAVQFFESLFANRSSRCRKLHNIAGSVVILDEAQMLPLGLLRPTMQAIKELSTNYRCSVVLCTATQPAIDVKDGFYDGFDGVRELVETPALLFEQLKRTTVKYIGEQTDAKLIEQIRRHEQLLIIVNNRRHARTLFDAARHEDGVFHLTTLMCAKHRTQVLNTIRRHLMEGRRCRVIATSLIEAGVDVDFPAVMREETGLDSVAQAAGRCNREGKRPSEDSLVSVFYAESQWKRPSQLEALTAAMRSVVRNCSDDLLAPNAIRSYFSEVYALKNDELDKHRILDVCHKSRTDFPFQTIAQNFRMIDNNMQPIIVPFDTEAQDLIERLRYADRIGGLIKKLQVYTVQVPQRAVATLFHNGRIELINKEVFGEQFYSLVGLDLYDEDSGLSWDHPDFIKVENLVF